MSSRLAPGPERDPAQRRARPTRRKVLRALAALPVASLVQGCADLIPGQQPPPTLYRLSPKSTFREDLPAVDWQLVIDVPLANAGLNTSRIALQHDPMQLEYYAKSSWTDRAPAMVQTLMVESFENSERIVSVGRQAVGLRANFMIVSDIREFQAEYFQGGNPLAHVNINVKLVELPQRVIVGSQSFEAKIDASRNHLDAVVVAFDEALGKALKRMVEWTIDTANEHYSSKAET